MEESKWSCHYIGHMADVVADPAPWFIALLAATIEDQVRRIAKARRDRPELADKTDDEILNILREEGDA